MDGSKPKNLDCSGEVLEITDIHKSFGDNTVLDGVSLALDNGENLAVLGRSGSGKSVLLRIILGLLEADAGRVRLWETDTTGFSDEQWAPLRWRCGLVFQTGALFDSMTVYDNVAFPLRQQGRPENEIRDEVHTKLEWVELPDSAKSMPSSLSGGMRRRVALARTLAASPEFILYDEPTTGLDPLTGRRISELMRELGTQVCGASILVTHDLQSAQIVSDRWIYLSNGKIAADGRPEELRAGETGEVDDFLSAYGWVEKG